MLLAIIRFFSTNEQVLENAEKQQTMNETVLLGKTESIFPQHMAFYSTTRNRGSLRIHHMMRLLLQYDYDVSFIQIDIIFHNSPIT